MEIVSYAMGEGAGYDEGYSAGYDAGVDADAYQEGYDAGEAAGYDEGYTAGSGLVKQLITARGGCANLFSGSSVTKADVENLLKFSDTTGVVYFANMFNNCTNLNELPNLDYSSASNISGMFNGSVISGTVSLLNTTPSSAYQAFFNCVSLQGLSLDLSNITDIQRICMGCSALKNVTFKFNNTVLSGAVQSYTFSGCKALENVTFDGSFTLPKDAEISNMFYDAFKTSSADKTFPYFDTSKVSIIKSAFACSVGGGQIARNTIPLYDFSGIGHLNNMTDAFKNRLIKEFPNIQFSGLSAPAKDSLFSNTSSYLFSGNTALEAIHITNIDYNMYIGVSTQFTREALVEIIGNLKDRTGTTAKTLTMGSTNMAKLTTDDIAVATAKNWTIA